MNTAFLIFLRSGFGDPSYEVLDKVETDFIETEKDIYLIHRKKYFEIEMDQAFVMSQQTFWDCYVQEHIESVPKTLADCLKDTFQEKGLLCGVVCTK